MKCEVGSDFWEYDVTAVKEGLININGVSKYKDQQLFISGRNAIQALLKKLSSSSKSVLLPAFTCNTVIQRFVKAGWSIDYYNIRCDLTINEENLIDLVEKVNPCLILVHGYFGFNTLEKSGGILKELRTKGITVVEDTTQTFFSSFKKTKADYYVSSLRKWFAISDGGLLVSTRGKMNIDYEGEIQKTAQIARDAFNTKAQYIKFQQPALKDEFIKKYAKLKQIIDECNSICPMTKEAQTMFSNADSEKMLDKRRGNYNLLLGGLKGNTMLECIFTDLPEDTLPLYFPVYIRHKEHREVFQKFLADSKIYCPVIWPKPEEYTKDDDIAVYIYDHILCIPCDQRYDEEDMKRVIACINEFRFEISAPDIYYMDSWGALCAQRDNGISERFRFESKNGVVLYQFVKKPVPTLINGIQYYDIVTPFGFNGPVITKCLNQEKLLQEFDSAFNMYCLKNNIVAEYVRFSPWLKNHVYMKDYYNLRYNGQTVFIDLRKDFFNEEFSSDCRGHIRKALKNNIEISFDFEGRSAEHFIDLYNNMTEKNKIDEYYRFDKEYIHQTFANMKGNIFAANALYEGKCISSDLVMFNETYIHGYLRGNDYEYISLGANSLSVYAVAKWAKERNLKEFHIGGARNESLLKHKKRFTRNGLLDYYVGTRVRNQYIYNELIDICGKNENGFFPEYRK